VFNSGRPHYQKDVEALERVTEKIYQDVAWYGGALAMRRDWRNLGCSHWNDGG